MIKMTDHLHQPVITVARKDFATLSEGLSVQQALDEIRSHGIGEKIVYFYVWWIMMALLWEWSRPDACLRRPWISGCLK